MGNQQGKSPHPSNGGGKKNDQTSAVTSSSITASTANKTNSETKTKTAKDLQLHGAITMTENTIDSNKDVYDYYEKVKHINDGSTCEIWLVRRKKRHQHRMDKVTKEINSDSTASSSDESPPPSTNTKPNDTLYVMKVINKSKAQDGNDNGKDNLFLKEMKNEVSILRRLDHPNIVRIYDLFETQDSIYLIMEYCSGGDLLARYPYKTEYEIAKLLTKVLSAVAYIHSIHVVHRDLKIENIIFENTLKSAEPKVIDFGLSKAYSKNKQRLKCKVGTLRTMSPQVLKGDYTSKADLWSVGVIAFKLLSGVYPFDEGESDRDLMKNIVKGEYKHKMETKEWKNVSKPAKDFVTSLLEYDPNKRKSATEALRSRWLVQSVVQHDPNSKKDSITVDGTMMDRIRTAIVQSSTKDNIFKKFVAMIVAHKSSNESLIELRNAFHAIDKNNHGTINYYEFKQALKQCNYSEQQLKSIFSGIDINHTGVINYTEFLAATFTELRQVEEELIVEAFDKIDIDNTGYISKDNICSIMGSSLCSQSDCDAIVNDVLKELDQDGDGTFTLCTVQYVYHLI